MNTEKEQQSGKCEQIAKLNDLCRKAPGIGGRWLETEGIQSLGEHIRFAIREHIENFADFNSDNDPYGERDFGAFTLDGHRIFWKIDYYARDMIHGSEDPADPRQTVRVLTVMLADEY